MYQKKKENVIYLTVKTRKAFRVLRLALNPEVSLAQLCTVTSAQF